MTTISSTARLVVAQVLRSSDNFGESLTQSVKAQGSGEWRPGPLWDDAIKGMRLEAGSLAQDLKHLKQLGPEVVAQLSTKLQSQYDDQLRAAKLVLDEIQTDEGGVFAQHLQRFRAFGASVAAELEVLLAKADAADASAAHDSVEGATVLGWNLVEEGAKKTVKVTNDAVKPVKLLAREAGGGDVLA